MSRDTQEETSSRRAIDVGTPGVVVVWSKRTAMDLALPLVRGRLVVGRELPGGALLPDERVSREHAEVRFDGTTWTVRDLGSTNGTNVRGERTQGAQAFGPGDVVRIGSTLLLAFADVSPFLDRTSGEEEGVVAGPAFAAALAGAARARDAADGLLVLGESGSGKELVARRFHAAGPLVPVNCAAIPATVAERLLFGARRGAYSGATEDAEGYLQAADGGTLFLDEMGELSLDVQAKLLRVLETREVLALGANKGRRVNVRFCFATHRDLRAEVARGRFRADLLYRIQQPQVAVPPLRERLDDVPKLVALAVSKVKGAPPAHARLVEQCMLRPWPGNVRELLAEARAAALAAAAAGADAVREGHLSASAGRPADDEDDEHGVASRASPALLTAQAIEAALKESGGNVAAAARALRLHRTQLYRRMSELGIEGERRKK